MPSGVIAYSFMRHKRIRFDLTRKLYQSIINTLVLPDARAKVAIAGECFTKYPDNPEKRDTVDLYVSTNHKDTMHEQLNSSEQQMASMLAEVNNILITSVDTLLVGDEFNRNIICQTTPQSHTVSWFDANREKQSRQVTVKILFTIQEMDKIDSLLTMFQLEPCKMAYKDGKFYFSDWFVRGGPIIAEGHEPSLELINKYLQKGFKHTMSTGWAAFCYDNNQYYGKL